MTGYGAAKALCQYARHISGKRMKHEWRGFRSSSTHDFVDSDPSRSALFVEDRFASE